MEGKKYKNSLEKVLDRKDRKFFNQLVAKMENDPALQTKICKFLQKIVGEDLCVYKEDRKFQVCLDYLIICLVSGDAKRKDFEDFLNK